MALRLSERVASGTFLRRRAGTYSNTDTAYDLVGVYSHCTRFGILRY